MAETYLHSYAMEHGWTELAEKLKTLDTSQLFSELDDTIQIDLLKISHENWNLMRSQKVVYNAICRELLTRIKEE